MNHGAFAVEDRQEWRWWVTPKPLREQPIHRWFVFPHSFTSDLVHALIEDWNLTPNDRILDPFLGAGTTLLAAKQKCIPATGYDLLPLATLVARVKVSDYQSERLVALWSRLLEKIQPSQWNGTSRKYANFVHRALPGKLLGAFEAIDIAIMRLEATQNERDFFRVALLSTIPEYSRAKATGGWLKWIQEHKSISTLTESFSRHVNLMLADVAISNVPRLSLQSSSCAEQGDARSLPDTNDKYSAVITSPPYPNRHDYTRVFGVELMFAFLDWEETRQLRYQSFHSHPESRPVRPDFGDYKQPRHLSQTISSLRDVTADPRVPRMIEGYFQDLYLSLRETRRVIKKGARVAFVVGNVRYAGYAVDVDVLTAEIGEQSGLKCEKLLVARYRGNSAQQMGKYGRSPARESVVIFRKL